MNKACLAVGCDRPTHAHGYCGMHYMRMKVHGNTETLLRRKKGTGWITTGGYHMTCKTGVVKQVHVLVAEAALGHELPAGALVHHVDCNRLNNAHDNLVIVPNDAYHALLHKRMRALDACGKADWLKCQYCQQYDDPKNLGRSDRHHRHRGCHAQYECARKELKRQNQPQRGGS